MRKLIAFDDDTADKLTQLGRDRMATLQELADEAFTDLLKKHGVPFDLEDALRKSARQNLKSPQRGNAPGAPQALTIARENRSSMKSKAYEEGRRAAAEDIPADANPYPKDNLSHAEWLDGHASIASAIERSQSEDI